MSVSGHNQPTHPPQTDNLNSLPLSPPSLSPPSPSTPYFQLWSWPICANVWVFPQTSSTTETIAHTMHILTKLHSLTTQAPRGADVFSPAGINELIIKASTLWIQCSVPTRNNLCPDITIPRKDVNKKRNLKYACEVFIWVERGLIDLCGTAQHSHVA